MNLISKQEGFSLKYKRQKELLTYSDKFQIHANGSCAHYGKIPKGCAGCFFNDVFACGIFLGCGLGLKNVCNANCKHCFTPVGTTPQDRTTSNTYKLPSDWKEIVDAQLSDNERYGMYKLLADNFVFSNNMSLFSFGGEGSEPLFYLPVISRVMKHYKTNIEPIINKTCIYKLYTNGKLLTNDVVDYLEEMGINELRVNPSAFGFSSEVFKNIEYACTKIPTVTVEVATFPEYKQSIFNMLPILQKIGVSHISLCQPKYKDMSVLEANKDMFPANTPYYVASNDWIMVDDGGLAEDIIKECIDKEYNFSVLDCNSMVMNQERQDLGVGKTLNNKDFTKIIVD